MLDGVRRVGQGWSEIDQEVSDAIADALRGMRYGEVVVKVEDGCIVYVDRHERIRMKRKGDLRAAGV